MLMDWNAILYGIAALAVVGGVAAVVLVIVDRFMQVPVDERAETINSALPGVNCGACGYAGCFDYAAAIVEGAEPNLCLPGGEESAAAIAKVLGTEIVEVAKSAAVVLCRGYCSITSDKFNYSGISSCAAAAAYFKGSKACSYGCLGYGDCVKVCRFDAMHIVNGVAVSDHSACNGCGVCKSVCPKDIIKIFPAKTTAVVFCGSLDKGGVSRKLCSNSCIGCTRCEKACASGALSIVDNLAVVDVKKCIGCEACLPVCPTGAVGMSKF